MSLLKTIRSGKRRRRPIRRIGAARKSENKPKKIAVENITPPGRLKLVDAEMYEAMKRALLKAIPRTSPGLTVAEMERRALAHLPEKLFPSGAKSGWWTKTVQLDLEARGILVRISTKPLRLRRDDSSLANSKAGSPLRGQRGLRRSAPSGRFLPCNARSRDWQFVLASASDSSGLSWKVIAGPLMGTRLPTLVCGWTP